MRIHLTLAAAACVFALTGDTSAEERTSSVDAKVRSTTEASMREQTALELRGARLRGLARADLDARVGAQGELETAADARLKNETAAGIEAAGTCWTFNVAKTSLRSVGRRPSNAAHA